MATTVSYNGTSYTVPQSGDSGWGTTLTTYLVALASGSLTKAGGLMTLTAELDLGANFGIRSIYFAGRSTPATAGLVRLGNTQAISWRNAANDGNLNLTVNASNALQFNSLPIVALALGAANTVLKMNSGGTAFEYGTLVNANINASAAIAYSKLNLATSIVNADINASAAIDGSKIVAASASVPGVVTTGTQTIAGNKTLTGVTALGTPATALSGVTALHSSTGIGAMQIAKVENDVTGSFLYLTHSRGTIGAESILSDDDQIGGVLFYGRGTSSLHQAASIRAYVDGTPGTSDMPARLEFATTADGASVPSLAMTIDSNQNVIVHGASASPTSIGHAERGLVLRSSDTSLSTGNYFPPIRWEATDSTLATTNPKTTAWIAAKAVEDFTSNSSSGTQIEFATSQLNGGNSVTPTVRMTIGSQGVVTVNEGIILSDEAGQDTLDYYDSQVITGASWSTNNSGTGATYNMTLTRVGKVVTAVFTMSIGSGPGTGTSVSAAGVIDAAFRPAIQTNVSPVRSLAGATYYYLQVSTAGTISFNTYNFSGTAQTHNNVVYSINMTWLVA